MEISEEHYNIMLAAILFYADPDTYFATFIVPDRPAGAINDDWSTHDGSDIYDDDDIRPGFAARKALELIGMKERLNPNYDFLKARGMHTSYYDDDRDEKWAKRGVVVE